MKKIWFFIYSVIVVLISLLLLVNNVINAKPNSYFAKKYLANKYKSLSWYNTLNFIDFKSYGFNKPSAKEAFIIDFSDNDLKYNDSIFTIIKNRNHFSDDLKEWRKTNLIFNKKNYKVKYKFHGTDLFIYHNNRFSLKIKSKQKINNAKKFNLISGLVEGSFINIFLSLQSQRRMLIGPDPGSTVLANINQRVEDFWFTRDISEDFLASNFLITDYKIFKNSDNWDRNGFGHYSELAKFYYYLDSENSDSANEVLKYNKFKYFKEKVVKNSENEKLNNIDYKYMGRFLANLYFFYDPHYIYGDNNRLLFDYKSNKVYPIARNEGLYKKVSSVLDFDEALYNYRGESATQILYKKSLCNDTIKFYRDKELFKIINNKDKVLGDLDSVYNKSYNYHKYYNISFIDLRYNYKQMINLINHNSNLIEKYLNNGEVILAYQKSKDSISVATDYRVPLKMINTVTNNSYKIKGVNFYYKKGKINFELKESKIHLKSKIDKSHLRFVNLVTGDTIPQKSIIFNYF